MLNQEARHTLRGIIQKEIQDLEASAEALKSQVNPISPDSSLGRLTRMDALVQKSTNEHLLGETRQRLSRLRECLEKVDREDYGLCRKCREPIAIGRLEAVPDAILCIECANAINRRRR